MGRAFARLIAERGDRLFLLGRDGDDLERSARDLEIRGQGGRVEFALCDLLEPAGFGAALEEADRALDGFDTFVITAALFASQEELESNAELRGRLLAANFANTIQLCEVVRARLLERGGGTLCVFSSVGGERPRKPVILYGATKAGISYYLNGLDHKFHDRGLRTVLVKPGFVKTGMTAGLPAPPFAGEPEQVARAVLKAIDGGRSEVFAPGIWRWIMVVIRMLPRFVMRRIGF
jgi:short-subunit dehydrogenase